jgi:hypothetical protein
VAELVARLAEAETVVKSTATLFASTAGGGSPRTGCVDKVGIVKITAVRSADMRAVKKKNACKRQLILYISVQLHPKCNLILSVEFEK